MKTFYLSCIAAVFSITINAQFQGPNQPRVMGNGTLTGSALVWVNIDNAKATDDLYADFDVAPGDIGSYTDYLMSNNYEFTIPVSATITGILVEIERSDPKALTTDYSIRLTKGGTPGDADKATGMAYPLTDAYQSFGGPGDLWGGTWTAADINSSDFGVAIAAQIISKDNGTAGQIDDIRMTIYYSLITLPVKLTAFNAIARTDRVQLIWSSSDETNMDRFEIERSVNADDFGSLGAVTCRNSIDPVDYSFDDMTPVIGRNFYRLAMYESTGEVNYSKIIAVDYKTRRLVKITPSFFHAGMLINLLNPEHAKLTIQFFNSNGQMNASLTTTSESISTANLGLLKGLIYYKIQGEKGEVLGTGKLMVQ